LFFFVFVFVFVLFQVSFIFRDSSAFKETEV
jgi:hypothetical protein